MVNLPYETILMLVNITILTYNNNIYYSALTYENSEILSDIQYFLYIILFFY